MRDLYASFRQHFNKKTDIPLDLRMCKGIIGTILRTISLTILADPLHIFGQSVASVSLVLLILAQSTIARSISCW